MNISCLTDINYLPHFLCLYDSLRGGTSTYHIHLLCVDEETYERVMSTGLPITNREYGFPVVSLNNIKITLYKLDIFEGLDDWALLTQHNKSVPGGTTPFHYALASYFTHYLIFQKELDNCLYMDSDILFFHPLDDLKNTLVNYSVGLVTHKHVEKTTSSQVGYYNVGIVYFKNDEGGRKCLELWKNCVVDPNNKWRGTHGGCGDQKYLELFEGILDKRSLCIIDESVGHTAPWNLNISTLYTIDNKMWVRWETFNVIPDITHADQPLLFHHFAHFRMRGEGYKVDWDGEWHSENWLYGLKRGLYDFYYEAMGLTMEKYKVTYKI